MRTVSGKSVSERKYSTVATPEPLSSPLIDTFTVFLKNSPKVMVLRKVVKPLFLMVIVPVGAVLSVSTVAQRVQVRDFVAVFHPVPQL